MQLLMQSNNFHKLSNNNPINTVKSANQAAAAALQTSNHQSNNNIFQPNKDEHGNYNIVVYQPKNQLSTTTQNISQNNSQNQSASNKQRLNGKTSPTYISNNQQQQQQQQQNQVQQPVGTHGAIPAFIDSNTNQFNGFVINSYQQQANSNLNAQMSDMKSNTLKTEQQLFYYQQQNRTSSAIKNSQTDNMFVNNGKSPLQKNKLQSGKQNTTTLVANNEYLQSNQNRVQKLLLSGNQQWNNNQNRSKQSQSKTTSSTKQTPNRFNGINGVQMKRQDGSFAQFNLGNSSDEINLSSQNHTINFQNSPQIRIVSAKQANQNSYQNQSQKVQNRKLNAVSAIQTEQFREKRQGENQDLTAEKRMKDGITSDNQVQRGKSESQQFDIQPQLNQMNKLIMRGNNPSSGSKIMMMPIVQQVNGQLINGQEPELHLPLIQTPKSHKHHQQQIQMHEAAANEFGMVLKSNLQSQNNGNAKNTSQSGNSEIINGGVTQTANVIVGQQVYQNETLSKNNSIMQSQKYLKRGPNEKSQQPQKSSQPMGIMSLLGQSHNGQRMMNQQQFGFMPQQQSGEIHSHQSQEMFTIQQQQQQINISKNPPSSMQTHHNSGRPQQRPTMGNDSNSSNYQQKSGANKNYMGTHMNSQYLSQASTGSEFPQKARAIDPGVRLDNSGNNYARQQYWFDEVNAQSQNVAPSMIQMALNYMPNNSEMMAMGQITRDAKEGGPIQMIKRNGQSQKMNNLSNSKQSASQQVRGGVVEKNKRPKFIQPSNIKIDKRVIDNSSVEFSPALIGSSAQFVAQSDNLNQIVRTNIHQNAPSKVKRTNLPLKTTSVEKASALDRQETNEDNNQDDVEQQMNQPFLLGEQDCGDDEPEDDDSEQNGNLSDMKSDFDEEGESENDNDIENQNQNDQMIDDESGESEDPNGDESDAQQIAKSASKPKEVIKEGNEFVNDQLDTNSKQSTQISSISSNDHIKFMSSLGSSTTSVDGSLSNGPKKINKMFLNKRKKSRKNKRGHMNGGDSMCSKINEVNESGDDDNQEQIQKDTIEKGDNLNDLLTQMELSKDFRIPQEIPKFNPDGTPLSKKQLFLLKPPSNTIILNYGPIPGRPPTIFFSYPAFLKIQRPYQKDRIQMITQDQLQPYSQLTFRITNTHIYNCVVNALKTAGFHMVTTGNGPTSWNLLWTTLIRPFKVKNMNEFQKVNHFPGAWALGSKANLWRNVQKQRRKHGKEFEVAPPTYIFPEDYKRWQNDREMNNYKDLYILKPTASSCGRGIKVIGKKDVCKKKSGYLVSQYIQRPHLLRGFKYDLRIYIVVTCFEPLKAYIFQDGLVRLATQPYSTGKGSLKKRFIHLTNYSINKKADNYQKNTNKDGKEEEKKGDAADDEMSSKWSLQQLKNEYIKMGIKYEDINKKIKDLCIKTLMSVEPVICSTLRRSKHRGQCMEIYGFDVIIDANLKAWLLEVNVLPSLSSSSPYDKQVKSMLLSDSFHLLGFNIFDRKKVEEEKRLSKKKLQGMQTKGSTNEILTKQSNARVQVTKSIYENAVSTNDYSSPTKFKGSPDKILSPQRSLVERDNYQSYIVGSSNHANEKFKIKDKYVIQSFLDGFDHMTEDDLEVLASYEEEQSRRRQTKLEQLFPTLETIDSLGPHFDCQRRSNTILWQYIKQKQPIHHLKSYYKSNPKI